MKNRCTNLAPTSTQTVQGEKDRHIQEESSVKEGFDDRLRHGVSIGVVPRGLPPPAGPKLTRYSGQ